MTRRAFDPLRLLKTLSDEAVRFVLIGGVALRMHGSPRVTNDTDICYDPAPENLERLTRALRSVAARRIADLFPEGVEVDVTPEYLAREEIFAFMTTYGQLDLVASPLGTDGFEELESRSDEVDIAGTTVRIASLDALRDMKTARDWPVDRADLEVISQMEQGGP
jgi:hypothetical protein